MTSDTTKTPLAHAQTTDAPADDGAGRLPRTAGGVSYVPGYTPPKRRKSAVMGIGAAPGPYQRVLPLESLASDARALAVLGQHKHLMSYWARALGVLAGHLPARTSLRQALAFAMIAEAYAEGECLTIGDLRESGQDVWGDPLIGSSIAKSYQLFLEPTKGTPDAVGWLRQVPDENDRRVKHLEFTLAGAHFLAEIVTALRGQTQAESGVRDEEFMD